MPRGAPAVSEPEGHPKLEDFFDPKRCGGDREHVALAGPTSTLFWLFCSAENLIQTMPAVVGLRLFRSSRSKERARTKGVDWRNYKKQQKISTKWSIGRSKRSPHMRGFSLFINEQSTYANAFALSH